MLRYLLSLALCSACSSTLPAPAVPTATGVLPPPAVVIKPLIRDARSTVTLELPRQATRAWLAVGATTQVGGPCAPSGHPCLEIASPTVYGPLRLVLGRGEIEIDVGGSSLVWQVFARWRNGDILASPATSVFTNMASSTLDYDGDGLSDSQEITAGTQLIHSDSDGGGTLDGLEVAAGLDPLNPADDLPSPRDCDFGYDPDGDGISGCSVARCREFACTESCVVRGADWDLDGLPGCLDPDCDGQCVEDCNNLFDDDADGLMPCQDPDCSGVPWCVEDCGSLVDQDRDGLGGCLDPDCATHPLCQQDCQPNYSDEDRDGLRACRDPDCAISCIEECTNGVDDDEDGLTDCEDAACFGQPQCVENDCGNSADDDNDGLADCEDDDCWGLGCGGIRTRVLSGSLDRSGSRWREIRLPMPGSQPRTWVRSGGSIPARAQALIGEIQRVRPSGLTTTCTWTMDSVRTELASTYYGGSYYLTHTRGQRIEAGCPLSVSNVIPQLRRGSAPAAQGFLQPNETYTQVEYTGSPILGGSSRLFSQGFNGSSVDYGRASYTRIIGYRRDTHATRTGVYEAGRPFPLP